MYRQEFFNLDRLNYSRKFIGKGRILGVFIPKLMEEYNRQYDAQLVELHFAPDSIFEDKYGANVDPQVQGFLIAFQENSLDHFKWVWDISSLDIKESPEEFTFETQVERKVRTINKSIIGKKIDISLFVYSTDVILKELGYKDEILLLNTTTDEFYRYIYKVYIGQGISEIQAKSDIRGIVNRQIDSFYLSPEKIFTGVDNPIMSSIDENYVFDIDYEEYRDYVRRENDYNDEPRGQWTKEDYEWGYATAYEFNPNNIFGNEEPE